MRAVALVALVALCSAAGALAGGPSMEVGAVEEQIVQPTLAGSEAELQLARAAGLGDAVRIGVTWARGETAPAPSDLVELENAARAAQLAGIDVYLIVYPYGSSQTPLSDADQADFAGFAAALARALPSVRYVIVGNEPNLNRFWLPQFGPGGEDVAAPAYEALLARTYDALKAVSPGIQVLGGALAHAGVDRPGTGRDTHSPTAFILDMGAAYRASGREKPIMDGLSFHPYMLASDQPPAQRHTRSTTITIADYWKLVPLLGRAFDGTAQPGSTLPIVYDEFGVESTIPAEKASLYTGTEPPTTHPVDQATQASYYAQAFALAFCQPNVQAILVFSLIDEVNLAGWQSGVYYADGTPKASLAPVAAAAGRVRRNVIAHCSWLHVTPRPTVDFLPAGPPAPGPSRFPVELTCDVDCVYHLRVEQLPGHSTKLLANGHATGGTPARILFPATRLPPGRYRFTLRATATENGGPPFTTASRPFTVRAPS